MSADDSIEWTDGKHSFRLWIEVDGTRVLAHRAELDKALESLGMKAVDKDVVTDLPGWIAALRDDERRALNVLLMRNRSAYIISNSNAMDGYRELGEKCAALESERDAAITAKEAADRRADAAREDYADVERERIAELRRLAPIVEAARKLKSEVDRNPRVCRTPEDYACAELCAAFSALDAGEASKPDEENSPGWLQFMLGQREGEIEELHEKLAEVRSALARAEEAHASAETTMVERAAKCGRLELEIERLRSELQAANNDCADYVETLKRVKLELQAEKARADELQERASFWCDDSAKANKARIDAEVALVTIVERTAKAQATKIADELREQFGPTHAAAYYALNTPLVTLSTLPEADSSGGGEKICRHCGKPETELHSGARKWCVSIGSRECFDPAPTKSVGPLCRHCGQPLDKHQGSGANPRYCGPLTSSTWASTFDPAPPKSEEPQPGIRRDGSGPLCSHCRHPRHECLAEGSLCGRWSAEPNGGAAPKAEAIDEWDDERCDEELLDFLRSGMEPTVRLLTGAIKRRNARIAELEEENEDRHRRTLLDIEELSQQRARIAELETKVRFVEGAASWHSEELDRLRAKCSRQRKELRRLNWRLSPEKVREVRTALAERFAELEARIAQGAEYSHQLAGRCRELEAELAEARKQKGGGE